MRIQRVALWITMSAALAAAQEAAPTFRAGTTLVELTLVALDKKGNPVTDLRAEELGVLDNGKARELAFFLYEGAGAGDTTPLPGSYRNRGPEPGVGTRNVTALVIDTINTRPQDQMIVKAQAMQLLKALAPNTRVALYQLGREFRVLHDFSDDMGSLRARLEKMQVEFGKRNVTNVARLANEMESMMEAAEHSFNVYRVRAARSLEQAMKVQMAGEINANARARETATQDTLAALAALGQHMTGIPGHKSLIWITGGATMSVTTVSTSGSRARMTRSTKSLERPLRQAAEKLAQAGVALYAVDARGLQTGTEQFSEEQDTRPVGSRMQAELEVDAQNSDIRAGLNLVTEVTGGRAFFGANDLSVAVKQASNDQRGAYTIAFYAPEETESKWHTLKLTTKRRDVELRYKQGYYPEAVEPAGAGWNERALDRALRDPRGAKEVTLEAECEPGVEPGELRLSVRVKASDLVTKEEEGKKKGAIEVVVARMAVDGRSQYEQATLRYGVPVGQWASAVETGLPYNRTVKVDETTLSVRVLVRDVESGRIGTLDLPVMRILTAPAPKK